MLYPKNKEKRLSEELFKNPTNEYRAAPFWSWNCKLDTADLCWQIEQFKKMGFGGFYMHPRTGLDTKYLGEEFMDAVKKCTEKAEKENMFACLYDEDRFSSGFAGGLLTSDPRYGQRQLLFTREKKDSMPDKKSAAATGGRYLEAVYDIVLNDSNELKSCRIADENDCFEGAKWYAYSELTDRQNGWFNNGTYVDAFSKEALDKFIQITHEKYKKTVGDKFGKTVPSIFTDEIWHTRFYTLDCSDGICEAKLPWSIVMEEKFREKFGFEILEKLPEAIWELPDGKKSAFRYKLHDFYTQLFTEAFIANVGDWCDKNGIALTGHMYFEETLQGQTLSNGEEMPAYRHMAIPGIDMFADNFFYTCAKQTQSIVHQDKREAMSSELYGVSNWDYDFRGHKVQGDWQAALGVTVRIPHLSHASLKGEAKRDYPAFISYQSPWYTEYKYMEDHYARINTAMTRGNPVVKVGVIHPIESCWINYGPKDKTAEHIDGLDGVFQDVCRWMLEGQIDFDYICESELPKQLNSVDGVLGVGAMKYDAVLVAGCETLRKSTLEILEKFKSNGGKLVFAGKAPIYEDAVPSGRPQRLYDKSVSVQLDKYSIVNAFESERLVKITEVKSGRISDNKVYQLRRDNECSWLFIANMKRIDKEHKNHIVPSPEIIRITGEFTPLMYDTLSGDIRKIDFDIKDGHTYIYHTFYQLSSLLLQLNPVTETSYRSVNEVCKTVKTEFVLEKVKYKREEPNVLLFDGGEYKIDDGDYRPYEDIRKIFTTCMSELGYKITYMQPWAKKKPKKFEHSVSLRFTFESEISVDGAELACESGEISTVLLNGNKVRMEPAGYFTDKSIKTYSLPRIEKGLNTLEITLPFGDCTELENYFILGEFNVRLEGVHKMIVPMTDTIAFGDAANQGMPFYGGTVTYDMNITAPEDCDAFITLNSFAGPVVKLRLDGKDLGHIAFSPYSLKAEDVKKGEHRLEIILYGNRHNCFSALHTVSFEEVFVNTNSWEFKIDESCAFKYEYELRKFGVFASPKIEYIKNT